MDHVLFLGDTDLNLQIDSALNNTTALFGLVWFVPPLLIHPEIKYIGSGFFKLGPVSFECLLHIARGARFIR